MRISRVWLTLACSVALSGGLRAQSQDSLMGLAGGELPPAGYGSLTQEGVSVRLNAGDVDIRFLPLDERVLRLMASDAYDSFHRLVQDRQSAIDSVASANGFSSPGLALVTFFAIRGGVRYEPLNVYVVIRNQLVRPFGLVPFTSNVASRQLDVRGQASAILLYDTPIPVFEAFSVAYGTRVTDGWASQLERIQRERARVMGKVRRDQADSVVSTQ